VNGPVQGVLFDLLMAVMNSLDVWATAARDRQRGLAWRDAVTARMVASSFYSPYREFVAEAAGELGLSANAPSDLFKAWSEISPWPDASAVTRLPVPYAFVTNCSTGLAEMAAGRSGLRPVFTLSAEEAGQYKPDARIYLGGCRRLGSPPERTQFVAGAVYDAEGARNAGLRAALVARRTDQDGPDARIPVFTSLDEVVAAIVTESQGFRERAK
jgi:2-haloacid dehalogenase